MTKSPDSRCALAGRAIMCPPTCRDISKNNLSGMLPPGWSTMTGLLYMYAIKLQCSCTLVLSARSVKEVIIQFSRHQMQLMHCLDPGTTDDGILKYRITLAAAVYERHSLHHHLVGKHNALRWLQMCLPVCVFASLVLARCLPFQNAALRCSKKNGAVHPQIVGVL
jgi:hypothetical protein